MKKRLAVVMMTGLMASSVLEWMRSHSADRAGTRQTARLKAFSAREQAENSEEENLKYDFLLLVTNELSQIQLTNYC